MVGRSDAQLSLINFKRLTFEVYTFDKLCSVEVSKNDVEKSSVISADGLCFETNPLNPTVASGSTFFVFAYALTGEYYLREGVLIN